MNIMIPATKRQCAKRDCTTYLTSYNEGSYCFLHSFSLAKPVNRLATDPAERPKTVAYRLAPRQPRQPWEARIAA